MDNLLTNPITTWREGRHTSERVLGHDTQLCRNLVLCPRNLHIHQRSFFISIRKPEILKLQVSSSGVRLINEIFRSLP